MTMQKQQYSPWQAGARWGRPLLGALAAALLVGNGVAFAQDEEEEPPPAEQDGKRPGPDRIRPRPLGPGGIPLPGPPPEGEDGPRPPPGEGPPPGPPPRPGGDANGEGGPPPGGVASRKVPCVPPTAKVTMDFADSPLADVVKYMAEITCRNFILSDDLKGTVTIISHQQVSVAEAYEAFLSALEVAGYTTVTVGKSTKIVQTSKAANAPLRVYEGDDIPGTDNFVTQIIELENVSVSEISTIVKELAGPSARVISYAPTNTLILTDAAYNIRRVYRIVKQLDVAAPKSKMEVVTIRYAAAADVERILEEVYGVAATSTTTAATTPASRTAASRRRGRQAEPEPEAASSTNVGTEGAFISKIIADERTNSLILLANEEAIERVKELIAQIDVDIDPASRSQIHVIYLDHAKADDVANVLTNLASGTGGTSGRSTGTSRTGTGTTRGRTGTGTQQRSTQPGGGSRGPTGFPGGGMGGGGFPPPSLPGGAAGDGATSGVAAAFEDVRIAADENTNSLVVIAAPEDFRILKGVIDRLDIPRRQVFVEAVVVEVGSDDEFNIGLGIHAGDATDAGGLRYGSAQLNGNSLQPDLSSLLSGLAMGVFGQAIDIEVADPTSTSGGTIPVSVPAFGIALNALASNSAVNIVSNPNLLVVDNEEATINVGRNVPFPVSAGRDNNNNPIVSYQREDVGITLAITPQINESNYVTLELSLEVAEVEEDSGGLDVTTAGFITSKRQTENVVVVQDNQTIVIGGLISKTQTEVQTKVPVLGDIPLLGVLFRGKRDSERKTNLLIFLTPHVINEPADLEEVYRVKWAQREEFLRRFYGQSREDQEKELHTLLYGSMNFVDEPTLWRKKETPRSQKEEVVPTGTTGTTGTMGPDVEPTTEPLPALPEPPPETDVPAPDAEPPAPEQP